MVMKKVVFITGFPRSGTTLVERIWGNQKDVFIGHQVFPTLLLNVKKEFLKQHNILRDYPFIPKPSLEEQEGFLIFLKQAKFTARQVEVCMKEGEDYPAMGEKSLLKNLPKAEGSLIDVIMTYLQELALDSDRVLGFKDVMMDDFIPYFKSQGVKSIVVVRDPRAVIYSLVHSDEMGGYRPTLYNLQVWKRSIRNATESEAHILSYKELIQNFKKELKYLNKLGILNLI